MWYYPASGLINGLTLTIFGIFVFLKNHRGLPNRTYAVFCLFISFWSYSYFLWQISKTSTDALFWCQMLMAGAIFVPASYFHVVIALIGKNSSKSIRKYIYLAYLLAIVFLILNFTPLMIKDVRPRLRFPFWPTAGPAYKYFLMYFAAYSIYGCYLLLKEAKKASGIRRNQFIYVFVGSALGYIGGATNFPLWYDIKLYPVGNILSSIYVALIGYAIIKHHLMDIKLARQYLAMNLFYGAVISAIFIVLAFFLKQWFLGISVAIFLAILLGPYFHRRMTKFLEPAFLGETYHTREQLDKLKEAELGYISEQIAWNLVGGISEIMQVDRISFFMFVANRKEFRPYAQIGLDEEIGVELIPRLTLKPESPLPRYLADSKKPLIKDEFIREASGIDSVVQEMQHLYAEISIPLFVRGELIGILNLGPKPNKEMYHQEDLKKLTELCHQAENHLSHTLFMEERVSFSRELAHDMKNLFTKAMWPTVESILEAKDSQTKDREFKTLTKQLAYTEQCLKDNFDEISLLERIVLHKFEVEPAKLLDVISASHSLYRPSLKEKGLVLGLEIPKDLPLVLMNKEDMLKVFNNLFDNSLKFTPREGSILIKAEQQANEVLITFSDTGKGMAKEDLERIFEPKLKMPEETDTGTGLGLIIVRDIIEAHRGRIRVESEKGKGTSFYFTLPVAKEGSDTNE